MDTQGFIRYIINDFNKLRSNAEKAISGLADEQIIYRPSSESNSIAVLMNHMGGNMISRWTDFFTTDGEKPWRNRDAEFEDIDIPGLNRVKDRWTQGWEVFSSTLNDLQPEDLTQIIYIRKEPHSVMDAILRQLSHYSYHIGQIIYIAKILKNESWVSLTIPKGKSLEFNKEMSGK